MWLTLSPPILQYFWSSTLCIYFSSIEIIFVHKISFTYRYWMSLYLYSLLALLCYRCRVDFPQVGSIKSYDGSDCTKKKKKSKCCWWWVTVCDMNETICYFISLCSSDPHGHALLLLDAFYCVFIHFMWFMFPSAAANSLNVYLFVHGTHPFGKISRILLSLIVFHYIIIINHMMSSPSFRMFMMSPDFCLLHRN